MLLKLRNHFRKLLTDLKPMTFGEKVDHIWTYYKEVFFTAGIVLLLILAMISSVINMGRQTLLYGVLGNVTCSAEGYKYMTEEFFAEIGGTGKKQEVVLDSVAFENAALAEDVDANYNASMRVVAMVSGKMVDYMLLDHYTMEFYIVDDFYMDLRELLSQEELDSLKDKLIYAQPEGAPEPYPVAIRATDMPFVQEHIHINDEIYLVFAANTQRSETCLRFWQWLKDWKAEK